MAKGAGQGQAAKILVIWSFSRVMAKHYLAVCPHLSLRPEACFNVSTARGVFYGQKRSFRGAEDQSRAVSAEQLLGDWCFGVALDRERKRPKGDCGNFRSLCPKFSKPA